MADAELIQDILKLFRHLKRYEFSTRVAVRAAGKLFVDCQLTLQGLAVHQVSRYLFFKTQSMKISAPEYVDNCEPNFEIRAWSSGNRLQPPPHCISRSTPIHWVWFERTGTGG